MREAPNHMRLTKNRRAVLRLLACYAYLRTSDFYVLQACVGDEAGERTLRRVLQDVWRFGHVVRRPLVDHDADVCRVRYEFVYWLSRSGIELAETDSVSWTPEKSPHSLDHEVAITDFHIALQRATASHGWELHWEQHGIKRTVNPDALFALTDPAQPADRSTTYHFLEVERSRQGNYREGQSALLDIGVGRQNVERDGKVSVGGIDQDDVRPECGRQCRQKCLPFCGIVREARIDHQPI